MELPENNLRILFRVNLIKSVDTATDLRRLFGGISFLSVKPTSGSRVFRGVQRLRFTAAAGGNEAACFILWFQSRQRGSEITGAEGLEDTETLRCCLRSDGEEGFLFVNNHHHGKQLPKHRNVKFRIQFTDDTAEVNCPFIPADVTFLMPVRMKMSDGVRLEYAFAQPVSREGKDYYFEEIEGMAPLFRFSDGSELEIRGEAAVGDVMIHVRRRRHPEEMAGKQLIFREDGAGCWKIGDVPAAAGRIRVRYYGDHIFVYTRKSEGEPEWKNLIADQFYYGDFLEFYKPEGMAKLEIRIQPLLPEKEVYLECERKNGAGLDAVLYWEAE